MKMTITSKITYKYLMNKTKSDLADFALWFLDGKNSAYHERDQLVALISKLFPASLERHQPKDNEDWDDEWMWVVVIDLPTGQASWHIHVNELPLFNHLPREVGRAWDGHTTEEKYTRIRKFIEDENLNSDN